MDLNSIILYGNYFVGHSILTTFSGHMLIIIILFRDRYNLHQTWERLGIQGPKSSSLLFGNLKAVLTKVFWVKCSKNKHQSNNATLVNKIYFNFFIVCFLYREHILSMQNGWKNMEKFLGELHSSKINDWHYYQVLLWYHAH